MCALVTGVQTCALPSSAHSPFKNIDALACPGGRHWVFGDKISARVPIAGLKERCRSDQIAAFVKRGANRQNARGTRRKIGAVSRNGRDSLGQLFRCDRGDRKSAV